MTDKITTDALAKLFDVTPKTIADLAKRGVIQRASRGRWLLEASVSSYCRHLPRLGAAQADLAAEKVKQMRGETLPTAEVEAFWRGKLRAFRNRILAIPNRLRGLSARQNVALAQELRAALTELADDKAT